MANRILFLVRHGQYTVSRADDEEPDGRLTKSGRRQAALTGQRLQKFPISVIHHSTLERAVETAEIIAHNLPKAHLQPTPLLRECIPSIPLGFEEFFKEIPPTAVQNGTEKARQAFETFISRTAAGETDQYELIVSHGNLISSLICMTLEAPLDSWILTDIQHAGISEITINSQGMKRVVRHNDIGHLPPHLHSFL